ncbi:WD repeat protein [Perkinsela sp. CCAP 1560/4]|nr:WD repeat protein [Perkinsela sp. CCAP 1560/4]|eukprot:KNH07207.1 WD repeat protein [Perkinsela sp. CCAP 1560/4]
MLSLQDDSASYEAPSLDGNSEKSLALQRYSIWRKHVRDLYHAVFVHLLDYRTMTVQVLPYDRHNYKHSTIEHSLVTGSCREQGKQSYISILKAVTPSHELTTSLPINAETGEVGGYGHAPSTCRIHTEMRIYHDGGVRRVRYVPWNPNILVSISTDGNAYVFDKTEIAISKKPNNPTRPLLPLIAERAEEAGEDSHSMTQESKRQRFGIITEEQQRFDADVGKGQHKLTLTGGIPGTGPAPIDISVNSLGSVVSGVGDRVVLWDILDYQCPANEPEKRAQPEVSPRLEILACGTVNDVKFSKMSTNMVYAACEGRNGTCIFDVRASASAVMYSPTIDYSVSIDPSPFLENCFAVGTGNGMVEFRDNRKMSVPTARFQAHAVGTEVSSTLWSIHNPTLLASAGEDGNVVFSDYPEGKLRFKHAGHTSTVDDISWSWMDAHKGMIASVSSEDSLCMFWKPRNHIWKK